MEERDKMSWELDEKALAEARSTFAMENSLERAIRAYLSASHVNEPEKTEHVGGDALSSSPSEMDVVAWRVPDEWSQTGYVFAVESEIDGSVPLVTLSSAQSALAAIRVERDEAWNKGYAGRDGVVDACRSRAEAAEARIKALEEALTDARTWHEEQDKALSKQPPTSGPNGNQWARLQHREQIDLIEAAIEGNAL